MGSPVILAVDPDPAVLADIERELPARSERHYRVICVGSSAQAGESLAERPAAADMLALVLAGQGPGRAPTALFAEARRAVPHAKRAMLIGGGEWGYRQAGDAIMEAIEHGRIDHYVVRPSAAPD